MRHRQKGATNGPGKTGSERGGYWGRQGSSQKPSNGTSGAGSENWSSNEKPCKSPGGTGEIGCYSDKASKFRGCSEVVGGCSEVVGGSSEVVGGSSEVVRDSSEVVRDSRQAGKSRQVVGSTPFAEVALSHLRSFSEVPEVANPVEQYIKHSHPFVDKFQPISGTAAQSSLSVRKTHEVSRFIDIIEHEVHLDQIEFVLEVGSGGGFLSREIMKRHPHLFSIRIENDHSKARSSAKLDALFGSGSNVRYLADFNLAEAGTQNWINSRKRRNDGVGPACVVIGLDLCGDLSSQALQLYCSSELSSLLSFQALFVVGCCYNSTTRLISRQYHWLNEMGLDFGLCGEGDLRNHSTEKLHQLGTEGCSKSRCSLTTWCFYHGVVTNFVEDLILRDRICYLHEHRRAARIQQAFSFQLATNNLMVVSTR